MPDTTNLTVNQEITIIEPGDYRIDYSLSVLSNVVSNTFQVQILKNGNHISHVSRSVTVPLTGRTFISDFLYINLNAGDTIGIYALSPVAFTLTIPSGNSLTLGALKVSQ